MVHQILSLLFSLVLLLPAGAQPIAIQELYVKPTEDTSCPGEPCHTLDEYVQNTARYFVSNTVFKFLPGTHSLSQPLNVTGTYSASNLAMEGVNGSVIIDCSASTFTEPQTLLFTEFSNLTLENLSLSSCYLNLADLLNFNLQNVSMGSPESYDLKLNAVNILGTSSFMGLTIACHTYCVINLNYINSSGWPLPAYNQLKIHSSFFSLASPFPEGEFLISSTLHQSMYTVILLLDNITFHGFEHYFDFYVRSTAPNNISMHNLQFNATGVVRLTDYTSASSTSVYIGNCLSLTLEFSLTTTEVTFEDSLVHGNVKEGFHITGQLQKSFLARNITFSELQGDRLIQDPQPVDTKGLVFIHNVTNLSFIACKFRSNNGRGSIVGRGFPIVMLTNSRHINFTNCEFSNNLGRSIASLNSSYILSGLNTFYNNSAYEGGAMALYTQSYVTFGGGSVILFVNNSADTGGGAFYVDSEVNARCFFEGVICDAPPPVELRFEGNTAGNGGERVYGASLDTCVIRDCYGWELASSIFHFDPRNDSDFSAITSDPFRACLCEDGRPSCTTVFSDRAHYPGETFNISAVVVGDRFGTVDGSVYAQIIPVSGKVAELRSLELSQRVEHLKCTNLSYTIFSNSTSITIALTSGSVLIEQYPSAYSIDQVSNEITRYHSDGNILPLLGSFPVYINITLPSCPLGFMLSGEPHGCICDSQLQNNHIPCNLTTQTVQRSGTEWVNASFHGNSSNGVIVSQYCPNNYCKTEAVDVNLEHPDTQCAFNHSGILCGGCRSGLSLALGSAQCLHCSNDYLALIIPFALAGFMMVFFIKLLNLTVAQGTLNGLIFYVNIVRANQVEWIPGSKQNALTVFIAWLNLDLGIETCFFDGLDAYWTTWLQFVFPLYIWTIVILIIFLSHYFSIAAKIFGSNSVQTLATLFLLSYPKLLRTIISIFQFSILDYPNGTSEKVWSYDGNIPYLSPKRIPLLLFATAVVVFLWLPYTGTLLFAQCLHRSSNYRIGKALAKVKPFLDAYFGPFKDKHRYWVGLLLLVRGILFIGFAATPTRDSEVDRLITLLTVLFVMLYLAYVGGVYKSSYLSLLENSYFLNLGILAGGTPYAGKAQSALAYTSVGIAFAQFVLIALFHGIVHLKETLLVRKLCQTVTPVRPQPVSHADERVGLVNEPKTNRARAQQLEIVYDDFREPVLKYLNRQT